MLLELTNMDPEEVRNYFLENDTVILVTGTTEYHGNHSPLGTDWLLAYAIAKEIGRSTGLLILPSIPIGVSNAHRQFYGTLWIPEAVFIAYIKAICVSIHSHGANKILIVNAHDANFPPLAQLAKELRKQGIFVSLGPGNRWYGWTSEQMLVTRNPEVLDIFQPEEIGHGAGVETSVLLHFYPELVKTHKIVDVERKPPLMEGPSFYYAVEDRDVTDGPLLPGLTTTASAEKGRRVMELFLKQAIEHAAILKKADATKLLSKSHISQAPS
jgi:creatinine amidohydrolase